MKTGMRMDKKKEKGRMSLEVDKNIKKEK
jgi:hypothetical protein